MLKFENFLKALYEQNDNEDPNMDYIKNLLVKMSNYVKKHNVGGNVNKMESISNEITLGPNMNFEITGIDEKGVNKKYKLKFIKNISGKVQQNHVYNIYSIYAGNKNTNDIYIGGYFIDNEDWENFNSLVNTLYSWNNVNNTNKTSTKTSSGQIKDIILSDLSNKNFNKYKDWDKISLIINNFKNKYPYVFNMKYGVFLKFKSFIFNKDNDPKVNLWLIQKLNNEDNMYYKILNGGKLKVGDYINFQSFKYKNKITSKIKITSIKKIK